MCEPVSIGVTLVALTAGSMYMQHQQATAEYEAQKKFNKANRKLANEEAQFNQQQITKRQQQEAAVATDQKFDNQVESLKAEARVAAIADGAGVTGLSVDSLIADVKMQEGRNEALINANLAGVLDQLQAERQSIEYGRQARAMGAPVPIRPSFVPGLLQIGLSGMEAYSGYDRNRGSRDASTAPSSPSAPNPGFY